MTLSPCLDPGQQELESQRRLAGSGVAFHQVQVPLRQPTVENIVQTQMPVGMRLGPR